MASNNTWWGYSRTHGWVLLDREDPRYGSRYQLNFIRCSDWTELEVGREDWDAPEYISALNYIAGLPESCRAGVETLLDETKEKWKEMKVSLAVAKVNRANEKAIAVRRAFWKSEIQQDIDDGNYIRAKERYSRNCADWWVIDIDEMLVQIKEFNQRRLAIVKIEEERKSQEDQQRENELERARRAKVAAEQRAAAHIVKRQQFKAYWQLKIAAQALSYLTNSPVDTSRDTTNSDCWVLHHDIEYLVGLYALRFDLDPPPEMPTWWATASKHFSVFTHDWHDSRIDQLSEEAAKLHFQRRSGCNPVFMEKTPAEHREEAELKESYREELYHERLQVDPNYLEDKQNQWVSESSKDSFSSKQYWNGFSSATHQPDD